MLPYGRKNPLPFPLFRSGHMSAICARLSQKEVGVKRVETLVSTLLPRRGARRIPSLRFSEKPPARQGRTRLRQFVSPAQPVLKKTAAQIGRTRYRSSSTPLSRCREKGCRLSGANPPTRFVFPAPPVPINGRKKGTRTGAFSIVVRSCGGGGTSYGRSPTDR